MSIINKAAVLNPFSDLATNILDYVPRATTSTFGIVAIGSGINVDSLGRIYLDTQEYADRLTAIEAQAASSLATQQTAVSAAIAQVNLAQSQTITALTLEVNNLKANLTNAITATETELIDRADQLAQNVTDITQQLTQDKAAFNQEIQDAIVYLQDEASVASALRIPRKIQGVDFDGTQDINLPVFNTQIDGLVPKRVGATTTKYLREDGTWVVPPNTTYTLLTKTDAETGTATTANTISAKVLKDAIQFHAPTVSTITGNAGTASKLQTSRTISLTGGVTGSVNFDGSANASIPTTITGLGVANGIATLDSSGQVPSTQLPSYVDDVLEYVNVAAFPATGASGKIYVETTGNTTYRWSGSGYTKITSGEVSSVAGKTGVVTLTKADVGLPNVDNTTDSTKNVASAAKLTTARTLTVGRTGKTFDGSANVAWTATEVLPTATSGQFLKFDGTNWIAAADNNTTYSTMSQAEANTGTATQDSLISASVLKSAIQYHSPIPPTFTGTAQAGLVPPRVGSVATKYLREDGSWVTPVNTTYSTMTTVEWQAGTSTTGQVVSPQGLKQAIQYHAPTPAALSDAEVVAGTGTDAKTVTPLQLKNAATTFALPKTGGTVTGDVTHEGNLIVRSGNLERTISIGPSGHYLYGKTGECGIYRDSLSAGLSVKNTYVEVSGSLLATGNITAYSDQRIKTNITVIEDALEVVKALRGVTFNRTDIEDTDRRFVGLVAQDVQAVIPEAVTIQDDERGTLTVDYQGLVGLLVEAIKELDTRVKVLESK